jgi:hypothetical protein
VTVVASDHYHTLHLIHLKMPVRVKAVGVEQVVYEGAVAAAWETALAHHPRPDDLDMVGILFADTSAMFAGRIDWLTQSRNIYVEDKADQMLKKKLEEETDL